MSYLQEEFIVVSATLVQVDAAMTERALMQRWMSPAVQFAPQHGNWSFAEGTRWQLTLSGLGDLLRAEYVVQERQPGLILWAFDGFWQGFDAWHWFAASAPGQVIIQNRIEYDLRVPGLAAIWPLTVGPLMGWDARTQMQRLKEVCEHGTAISADDR
ncbi:SRPBCC family protein [Candidatus Gracilibacteria bacterium]|nr:SRPBCC family protein [Candidatus Gracilibacteria bacterium]